MHSSRMRTGRSLTVFRSLLHGGGVCSQGGVCSRGVSAWGGGFCSGGCLLLGGLLPGGGCLLWGCLLWGGVCSRGCLLQGVSVLGLCLLPGGVCSGGVCSQGGCGIPACTEADTPLVNRMTNRCKNITLATTSLRPVFNIFYAREIQTMLAFKDVSGKFWKMLYYRQKEITSVT